MRLLSVAAPAAWSTLALALSLAFTTGCSSASEQAPAPAASAAPSRATPPPVAIREARDLVQAANLEITNLGDMQARVKDEATREAIARQIGVIRTQRDAVEADLMRRGTPVDDRLRADVSNLDRAIRAGASANLQRVEPPTLQP